MQLLTPITLLSLVLSASALGPIVCRGSAKCGTTTCRVSDLVAKFSSISDTATFVPGQHIVCCNDTGAESGICAFTENTDKSITGKEAKTHIQNILNRGCTRCATDSLVGNDITQGALTVNWVAQV